MKNYIEQRNREFIALCRAIAGKHLANNKPTTVESIIDEALSTPPKAHYIEYDRAAYVLQLVDRMGFRRLTGNELQKAKWIELSDQVCEAMSGPRRLPFASALAYVLTFRRPSRYYFSEATARKLIAPYIRKAVIIDSRA